MTLDAVVFDFDGLIIDSEWAIFETAQAAFAVHGHELTVEAWATIVGLGDDDDELAWSMLTQAMGIEGFDNAVFSATYAEQDRVEPRLAPAAARDRGARRQPRRPRASRSAWRRRRRSSGSTATSAGSGIRPRFGAVIGADLVGGVGKPAPDVYLRACADLGADPARVGRARGLRPRRRVGQGGRAWPRSPCRAASPGSTTSPHADLVVDSVADLTVAAARAAGRPGDRAEARR